MDDPETGESEQAYREAAVLKRLLSTPHKKQADMNVGKRGAAEAYPRSSEEVVKDSGDSPKARR